MSRDVVNSGKQAVSQSNASSILRYIRDICKNALQHTLYSKKTPLIHLCELPLLLAHLYLPSIIDMSTSGILISDIGAISF